MSFLRAVKGCTGHDRLRNEDIRNELGIEPIRDKLSNYRQNWETHLERMSEERIPKQILYHQPRGRRTVGRPWKRWNQMWDRNCLWRNPWRMTMICLFKVLQDSSIFSFIIMKIHCISTAGQHIVTYSGFSISRWNFIALQKSTHYS
jgi:hypothetical protein